MPNIPSFNAQITQINVPTMKNYQEEQNNSVYKAVAAFSNTAVEVASELYVKDQEHKAMVEGGKIKSKDDLKNLPAATTKAQAAYNEAAISSFASDFLVNSERIINEAAFKNENNPELFLEETGAYLSGISKNIPEHLKTKVLKPVEMARESKYDTLLKNKSKKDTATSIEQFKFNGYRLSQNANFIQNDDDLNRYLSEGVEYAQQMIFSGGKADDAQTFLKQYQESGILRYLSKYYLKEKIDPQEYKKFFSNVVIGKTGIQALDFLPPERRIDVAKKAFSELNETENFLSSKSLTITSNQEAVISLGIAQKMAKQIEPEENPAYFAGETNTRKYLQETEETRKSVYNSGYSKPQLIEAQKNIDSGNIKETIPKYAGYILDLAKSGGLTVENLDQLKDDGIVGDKEYIEAYAALGSFVVKNRQLPQYKEALANIEDAYPDRFDEYGNIIETNKKRNIIIEKLKSFVDSKEVTGQEINEYANSLISNTNSMIKDNNEYDRVFTKEKFKKTFGVNYSDIDNLSLQYTAGNAINRHQMHKAVMEKYRVDRSRANAILTYWNKIRNMEKNK